MLYLDIVKVCNSKAVSNPRHFLVSIGFDHAAASRLLQNTSGSVKLATMEKICLHLNCTPNELMSWKPPTNLANTHEYNLEKLKPIEEKDNIVSKLKRLPSDKLDKLRDFLEELENDAS